MTYSYVFHPIVAIELQDAIVWYETISAQLANKLKAELKSCFELILTNPFICQVVAVDYRLFHLKRFPYSIVYSISEDTIFVYSFFHTSRNPDVWKNRIF